MSCNTIANWDSCFRISLDKCIPNGITHAWTGSDWARNVWRGIKCTKKSPRDRYVYKNGFTLLYFVREKN